MTDAKPDTSEAEVVRAAEMLEAYDFDVTAALLRTLLAERDALRAERDATVRERDGWTETARHFSEGSDYYRGLLVRIGQTFGREAQIADDGSDMREVLVAKVPDLVAALRAQRDSLRDALEKALEWIEGWDPGFTMEPDWPADHAAMRGVLATLREAGHE